MKHMALDLYRDLFSSEGSDEHDTQGLLDIIPPSVTEEMNQALTTGYSDQEIEVALF
jgi:hypothetical protein